MPTYSCSESLKSPIIDSVDPDYMLQVADKALTRISYQSVYPKGWKEQLYNLEKDPFEINNLFDHPENQIVLLQTIQEYVKK